jgi:hypothetical protein
LTPGIRSFLTAAIIDSRDVWPSTLSSIRYIALIDPSSVATALDAPVVPTYRF